ncbi:MAG: hypothetical protein ACSHYB_17065 [Roseibacillus sp.]
MKTLIATELKTRTGEFFEALLTEGCVTITRNGRSFPLRLETRAPEPRTSLGSALAMDLTDLDQNQDWDFPKVDLPTPKTITFEH